MARYARWTLVAAVAAAPAAAQQNVALPARDKALREKPAEVFTVGTVEGADWEMFSGIRSVVFDRSDNMYLLDGQNTRIVVFDARGRFVRQFGKKGGGPGELQAPLAMDIGADGNLIVSDLANRAFVVFRPTGEHVRNVPFDDELGMPIGLVADRQGGVVTRTMPRIRPDQPTTPTASFSPIVRQSLTGGAAPATLYRVPVDPPKIIENSGSGGARRIASISMDPVFAARPTFGVLPTGVAVHHETDYTVRILDNAGQPVRTITRGIKPKKVTKKDQEAWQKQRAEDEARGVGPTAVMVTATDSRSPSVAIGRGGQTPGPMRLSMDNVTFAEFMSVVSSVRTDPQGRIWVQRRAPDGRAAGPIDLVMADGRYIGTLPAQPLPNAVSPSGLAAWVVTDPELGVERVAVRRLPAAWR
jgi:hypothetical protein